ncbi:hypothetical protein ACLEJW_11945 [Pseudomonas sp. SMSB3]|nr:hypothetical protein [Pseudomonas sp.]
MRIKRTVQENPMVWWLEILAQFVTSTGLAVSSIFVFWAYTLAFGRGYTKVLSAALAAALLSIAAFPHGVSFVMGNQPLLGNGSEFVLLLADALGVITAVLVASFFFSPGRLFDEA